MWQELAFRYAIIKYTWKWKNVNFHAKICVLRNTWYHIVVSGHLRWCFIEVMMPGTPYATLEENLWLGPARICWLKLLTKLTEIKPKQNKPGASWSLYISTSQAAYIGCCLRYVALNCASEKVTPYFSIYLKNLLEKWQIQQFLFLRIHHNHQAKNQAVFFSLII